MARNQNQLNEQGSEGRISNTNDLKTNEKTNPDISNMDKQEGEMNHGELGSNLKIKSDGQLDADE